MKIVETANEANHQYAPHLLVREFSLTAGREWTPLFSGWCLIQVANGSGYWLEGQSRRELEAGAILLLAENVSGRILASCLNGVSLVYFTVLPDRLIGLITQAEQIFKQAARRELAHQVMPPTHPIAARMKELCGKPNRSDLQFRLILLQLLIEAFGKDLNHSEPSQPHTDVKERLHMFLQETPPAALLEISFEELAQITHCTPRHLSRVFYELAGMSFRDKRAEIRLARARELLATSQSKVVDVAFKSGYKSLSLFNRMFTRRFGISPGRWRQKNVDVKSASQPRSSRLRLTVN